MADIRNAIKTMDADELTYMMMGIIEEIVYGEYDQYQRVRFCFSTQASNLLEHHDNLDPQACIDCQEGACFTKGHNSQDGE